MATKLREVLDGFGLEEVPRSIAKEAVCCVCMAKWPGKLWTPEPLPTSSNLREYGRQCDAIRLNCYCRTHVLFMFGDNS